MDGFRGPQICSWVGISYRQIDYWCRTGLIRPSVVDALGSGFARLYSYNDVVILLTVKTLLDGGLQLSMARLAANEMQTHRFDGTSTLVLYKDGALLINDFDRLKGLLEQGFYLSAVLPLKSLMEKIDADIEDSLEVV